MIDVGRGEMRQRRFFSGGLGDFVFRHPHLLSSPSGKSPLKPGLFIICRAWPSKGPQHGALSTVWRPAVDQVSGCLLGHHPPKALGRDPSRSSSSCRPLNLQHPTTSYNVCSPGLSVSMFPFSARTQSCWIRAHSIQDDLISANHRCHDSTSK